MQWGSRAWGRRPNSNPLPTQILRLCWEVCHLPHETLSSSWLSGGSTRWSSKHWVNTVKGKMRRGTGRCMTKSLKSQRSHKLLNSRACWLMGWPQFTGHSLHKTWRRLWRWSSPRHSKPIPEKRVEYLSLKRVRRVSTQKRSSPQPCGECLWCRR